MRRKNTEKKRRNKRQVYNKPGRQAPDEHTGAKTLEDKNPGPNHFTKQKGTRTKKKDRHERDANLLSPIFGARTHNHAPAREGEHPRPPSSSWSQPGPVASPPSL